MRNARERATLLAIMSIMFGYLLGITFLRFAPSMDDREIAEQSLKDCLRVRDVTLDILFKYTMLIDSVILLSIAQFFCRCGTHPGLIPDESNKSSALTTLGLLTSSQMLGHVLARFLSWMKGSNFISLADCLTSERFTLNTAFVYALGMSILVVGIVLENFFKEEHTYHRSHRQDSLRNLNVWDEINGREDGETNPGNDSVNSRDLRQ